MSAAGGVGRHPLRHHSQAASGRRDGQFSTSRTSMNAASTRYSRQASPGYDDYGKEGEEIKYAGVAPGRGK